MTTPKADLTELDATVLFEVDGATITKIDMCQIPPPHTCARSGECPGLFAAYGIVSPKGPVN
jgi:hypothetical protein